MTATISRCFVLLTLLVPAGLAQDGDGATHAAPARAERILRTFDVSALTRVVRPLSPTPRGSLLIDGATGGTLRLGGSEDHDILDENAIIDSIRALDPQSWEGSSAAITSLGPGRLLVRHDAAMLDRIGAWLDEIASHMARRIRLDVHVLTPTNVPATGPVLGRQQMTELLASFIAWRTGEDTARLLWSASTTVVAGEGAALGTEETRTFVGTYGAEVAQKAHISDPRPWRMLAGSAVQVLPYVTTDGQHVALYGFVRFAWPAKVTTVNLGINGVGTIDRPVLDHVQLQVAGLVEDGGGLALVVDGDATPALLVVIRATLEPAAPRRQAADAPHLLPIGALATSAFQARVQWPPLTDGAFGHALRDELDADHDTPPRIDAEQLVSLCKETQPAVWEGEGTRLNTWPNHLVIKAPADVRDKVTGVVQGLEKEDLGTIAVEVAWLSSGTPRTAAPRVLGRVRIPLQPSREAFFLRGRESTAVADWDVSIAQEAIAANPVVCKTFQGMFGRLRWLGGAATAPLIEMEVELRDDRTQRVSLDYADVGAVDVLDRLHARLLRSHAFTDANPLELGDGPILVRDGERIRTSLQARLLRP